jgi:hypothetical protein
MNVSMKVSNGVTAPPNEVHKASLMDTEVMMFRLRNKSKNNSNNYSFCHIFKASLSAITRNIKTMPAQLLDNSIKKSIDLIPKIIGVFPTFF